jgi:hypothetical protein
MPPIHRSSRKHNLFRRFFSVSVGALIATLIVSSLSGIAIYAAAIYAAQTSWLEETWGQAGAIAYQAAAKTMLARNNQGGRNLDNFQKSYLRRDFRSLTNRVGVVYAATLMDRWQIGNSIVHLGAVDSAAQTYCDRIYIRAPYQPENKQQLILLAHEMVHAKQCQQLGGMGNFGYEYFKEYKRANQKYERNKLEREAFVFQRKFAASL